MILPLLKCVFGKLYVLFLSDRFEVKTISFQNALVQVFCSNESEGATTIQ